MTFGERLSNLLELRGWSHGKLAARSGLSRRYIGMIISGERDSPSLVAATRIAKALGVSLDWLADLPPIQKETLTPDEQYILQLYRAFTNQDVRRMMIESTRAQLKISGGTVPEPPEVTNNRPSE